jgi:RNA polymerase sigma-70 factor (ECF subfamily)
VKEYSEENLIRQLNEGDERAFKFVFESYYRPLTLFATKYVADIEEAKEVVQNFFVRLWVRRSEIKIRFSLKMYLYQSVRNACLNQLESTRVVQRHMQAFDPDEVSNDNALEHLILAEQEEMLMRAIDRLPEKCRQIFVMSRMHKVSNLGISSQLNISVKTVEAQLSIALKRLTESLITVILCFFSACFPGTYFPF